MSLQSETIKKSKNITEIYVFDEEKPDEKHLAYRINRKKDEIVFFPREDFPVSHVLLKGFKSVPDEMSENGYFKAGLTYYFNKKLRYKPVKSFTITKEGKNSFRKIGDKYNVVLNYASLKSFKDDSTQITNESKYQKSQLADEFFHKSFPRHYPAADASSKRKATKVIKNLDESIIGHLGTEESEKLISFFQTFISKRYKSDSHKHSLFSAAKIKVDNVAISEIIASFEKLLSTKTSEANWGKFLQKNLYLIDSKYISVIPQLNVVLAGSRNVDFGLIDSQGFLDIFEIKLPTAKVLSTSTDRGNYYWSTEATKAIIQAEKYLYNAERKATGLTEDIKREKNVSVSVIRPRAYLVIGTSAELDNESKQQDFRIIRHALKNVEVILYDELLIRLKNQKDKSIFLTS